MDNDKGVEENMKSEELSEAEKKNTTDNLSPASELPDSPKQPEKSPSHNGTSSPEPETSMTEAKEDSSLEPETSITEPKEDSSQVAETSITEPKEDSSPVAETSITEPKEDSSPEAETSTTEPGSVNITDHEVQNSDSSLPADVNMDSGSSNVKTTESIPSESLKSEETNVSDDKASGNPETCSAPQLSGEVVIPPAAMETVSHQQPVLDSPKVTANKPPVQRSDEQENLIYHLKWFEWKGLQTPIVTQNENGPCPLLAIANVLILARKIELPPMQQIITGKQLMEYIGDCILASVPDKDSNNEELMLNYEQNVQDAIDIMYKLQTGIDVNVKFTGVTDFEFTRECIVFDLLKIILYHGWLVDPQDTATANALNKLSYNQAAEKMIAAKCSTDDSVVSEGLIVEEFINNSASQLTYFGLCELNHTVQDEELCVFFRNNHFSTLYKHKDELFILVTDQGFLTEPAVIWETLVNIEGDGQFVNSDFRSITLQSNALPPPPSNASVTAMSSSLPSTQPAALPSDNLTQEDQDYLIALSLQQENGGMVQQSANQTTSNVDSDHALALKLQEDENRRIVEEQQHHPQMQQRAPQTQQRFIAQQQQQQQQQEQQQPPPPSQQQQRSSQSKQSQNCSIL